MKGLKDLEDKGKVCGVGERVVWILDLPYLFIITSTNIINTIEAVMECVLCLQDNHYLIIYMLRNARSIPHGTMGLDNGGISNNDC